MKISEIIESLQHIKNTHGDIPVQLQGNAGTNPHPSPGVATYMSYESFFIVPEEYEEGFIVNIRSWPY